MWTVKIKVSITSTDERDSQDDPREESFEVEEAIPGGLGNLEQWEQATRKLGFDTMRQLFTHGIGLFEEELLDGFSHAAPHGQVHEHFGKRGQLGYGLATVFGKVRFQRQRLRCQECGQWITPLNEALGLHKGSHEHTSLGLQQLASYAAVDDTYRVAVDCLGEWTQEPTIMSHQQVKLVATSEGARVRQQEEDTRHGVSLADVVALQLQVRSGPRPPLTSRAGQLYVCLDGIFVRSAAGKGRWQEAKVGLLCNHEREPVGTKGRQRVVEKRYLSSFGTSEVFGSRVYAEALQMGLREYQEVFVVGDGARWIREIRKQCFPHARYLLDWYHLHRKVCTAFRLALPEDKEQRRAWRRPITKALWSGEKQDALEQLEAFREAMVALGKEEVIPQRHGLDELIAYVRNNWEGIVNYRQMQKDGYVIASSLVEKAADVVVAKRQKKSQGMHWSRQGADGVCALRTLWLNGDWDDYWQLRRDQAKQAA